VGPVNWSWNPAGKSAGASKVKDAATDSTALELVTLPPALLTTTE
jgi:hypothetical protein